MVAIKEPLAIEVHQVPSCPHLGPKFSHVAGPYPQKACLDQGGTRGQPIANRPQLLIDEPGNFFRAATKRRNLDPWPAQTKVEILAKAPSAHLSAQILVAGRAKAELHRARSV